MTDDAQPGWDAIDRALAPLYGGREPEAHFGTAIPYFLGGPDPIHGISAYKVTDLGPPHWHLITYGFTELWAKEEGSDPDISGFGFEIAMRLACDAGDAQPPPWCLNLLQNMGRYVFGSGNVFGVGHHLNANGPIALGVDTVLHAIAFAKPPRLEHEHASENGRFEILHLLGISLDELAAMKRWNAIGVLDLMRARDPLHLTDLARPSFMDDDAFRAAVDEGAAAEGSSQGSSFVTQLAGRVEDGRTIITIGGLGARDLGGGIRGRLLFGRPFAFQGPEAIVSFEPADACRAHEEEGLWIVELTEAAAREVAEVPAKRGTYPIASFPALVIEVIPTEIKDHRGEVAEVVG